MLTPDSTVVVLVDLQVKLARVMHEREALIENAVRLVGGTGVLGMPVVRTEQNPAGLGPTVPEVAELLSGKPIAKLSFSCCGEQAFVEAMDRLAGKQVLLAGIESHVCVWQTAADLLSAGHQVQVVTDAVSSRTAANKAVGITKMRDAGAAVTSVEAALLELLKTAEGPKFQEVLRIIK